MKISIIGAAGTLGASCAMVLSMNKQIKELCLIDINEKLLDNHIMDLENAFPSKNIYRGTYESMNGSNVIIITAGVPNRNDETSRIAYLKDNITIFKTIGTNIAKFSPNALIVTASNPVDLLNYYLANFGFKHEQLIGYSLNDSYRFEWAIRKTLKIDSDITIDSPVIGEHGNSQVPLFSHVKQNNQKLIIHSQDKEKIKDELSSWFVRFNGLHIPRTTGWTTGVGIGQLVTKLLTEENSYITGSAILNGEYNLKGLSIGVPLLINKNGIQKVIEWELDASEEKAFQYSAKQLKTMIDENKKLFST